MTRARSFHLVRPLAILFVLGGVAPACIVVADNPFDPETPLGEQATATIEGSVRAVTVSGEPVLLENAGVSLETDGNAVNDTTTDEAGAFTFEEVAPRAHRLRVTHASHFSALIDVRPGPGDTLNPEILLYPLPETPGDDVAHLTGTVQKSGELLQPEVEQDHSGILVELGDGTTRAVTNRAGRFDLFVIAGTYDLVFSAPDYNEVRVESVVAAAGETTEASEDPVVLQPNPGRISGTVLLEGVDDAMALGDTLVSAPGGTTDLTATDGAYLLADLPAGVYSLTITRDGYETVELPGIVVEGGRLTEAPDVTLAIARGSITGVVQLTGRTDFSGTTVELTGTTFTTQTSTVGAFSLTGIPEGSYELTARRDGFVRGVVGSVAVTGDDTTDVGTLTLVAQQGNFDINNGALYTSSADVTLSLAAQNAAGMRISEDSNFADTDWVTYDAAPSLTLSSGDGTKTIYVQVRDGNGIESGIFVGTIVLDGTAPQVVTATLGAGNGYVTSSDGSTSVGVSCADAVATSNTLSLRVEDGSGAALYNGNYASVVPINVGTTPGNKSVAITCSDPAGNTSSPSSIDYTHDFAAPTVSAFTVTGAGGNARTNSTSARFSLTLTDPHAGGATAAVDEAPFNCATARYDYGASETDTSFTLSAGDGNRSLYVCTRDAAGNVSASAVATSNTVELDTTGPATPALTRTALSDKQVGLAWTVPGDADLASFVLERRLANEGAFASVGGPFGAGDASYTDAVDTAALGAKRFYRVRALDDLGNPSGYSIELDAGVPMAPVSNIRYQRVPSSGGRRIDWTLPEGASLALSTYRYEKSNGQVNEEALATNATGYTLTDSGIVANEELVIRVSNADLSLVWESTFRFGSERTTLDESSASIGTYTSVAVDSEGVPHIAYYDSANEQMMYLKYDGGSAPQVLETPTGFKGTGLWTSIAIDGDDIAHVAWCDLDNTALKYQKLDGGSPVETLVDGAGQDTGRHSSLDVDSNGIAHLVYYNFTTKQLWYLKHDGTSAPQLVDDAVANGGYNDMKLDANDVPHVAYWDDVVNGLMYAVLDGVTATTLIAASNSPGDQGVALDIDREGIAHVAWYDGVPGPADGYYQKLDSVSARLTVTSTGDTGRNMSMALDPAGVPHAIWYDRDQEKLFYAEVNQDSPVASAIDEVGNTGRFNSLAIGPDGALHMASFNGSLRYFRYERPEPGWSPDSTGSVGDYPSLAIGPDDVPQIAYADRDTKDLKLFKVAPFELPASLGYDALDISVDVDSNNTAHIAFNGDDQPATTNVLMYLVDDGSPAVGLDTNSVTGKDTSIGVDNNDVAHIVYFNDTRDEVWYVRSDGMPQLIEAGMSVTVPSDIAFDSNDVPHAVWYDWNNGNLRYTALDNINPVTLDNGGAGGNVGHYPSLVFDADDVMHVAYHDEGSGDLLYLRADGASSPEVLDSEGDVGQWTDITIGPDGYPNIVYEDASSFVVKYVRVDGFNIPVILDETKYTGALGNSIAFDSKGMAHVAYCDCRDNSSRDDLRYARGRFVRDLAAASITQE